MGARVVKLYVEISVTSLETPKSRQEVFLSLSSATFIDHNFQLHVFISAWHLDPSDSCAAPLPAASGHAFNQFSSVV